MTKTTLDAKSIFLTLKILSCDANILINKYKQINSTKLINSQVAISYIVISSTGGLCRHCKDHKGVRQITRV